jgi:hypothetical protein
MNDRPTAAELVAAARHYLETELIPTLTDQRLRFQTLVAANVLGIAEREWATEAEHLLEEWRLLAEVLNLPGTPPERLADLQQEVRNWNGALCERIRQGDFDGPAVFLALARQLRRTVERKLEVANPRYLAGFRAESGARGKPED